MNKLVSVNVYHLILLIIIDILGLNKLWGERLDRRVLHHLQRNVYNKNRKPEIYLNQKMYNEDLSYFKNEIFDKIYNLIVLMHGVDNGFAAMIIMMSNLLQSL